MFLTFQLEIMHSESREANIASFCFAFIDISFSDRQTIKSGNKPVERRSLFIIYKLFKKT